jgi:hypothetical protein
MEDKKVIFDVEELKKSSVSEERLQRLTEVNTLYSQNAEVFSNIKFSDEPQIINQ